jgi:hypothetical protein
VQQARKTLGLLNTIQNHCCMQLLPCFATSGVAICNHACLHFANKTLQLLHRCLPQVWAMLLYLDDVLGRLFESVAASGLADSTYILLTADNGPGLPKAFLKDKLQRLVSLCVTLRLRYVTCSTQQGEGIPLGANERLIGGYSL